MMTLQSVLKGLWKNLRRPSIRIQIMGVIIAKLLLYIQRVLAPHQLPAAAFLLAEAVVFIRAYKEIRTLFSIKCVLEPIYMEHTGVVVR